MALVYILGAITMTSENVQNLRYTYTQKLQNMVGSNLIIRINNNRSTMLHVRWKETSTHVSLHHMFLKAPHTVQKGLASYIRQDDTVISQDVQAFIDKNLAILDHSYLTDPDHICTKGTTYDLQKLYNKINKSYFNGELDLLVTWFADPSKKVRTKCTLGLYYDLVKLVKIHRLLDNPLVPLCVIEYVMYHEMVHAVCPIYKDEKGRNCIHSREFKVLERQFLQFEEANKWLKEHRKKFFLSKNVESKRVKSNGRTQQMGKHKAPKK